MRVLTLAAAVGLLGAMLLFVGHSLGTMTGGDVRSVPLDWQGPVASNAAAQRLAQRVARQPGVLSAQAVATAPFAGLEHTSTRAGTWRVSPPAARPGRSTRTTNPDFIRVPGGTLTQPSGWSWTPAKVVRSRLRRGMYRSQ